MPAQPPYRPSPSTSAHRPASRSGRDGARERSGRIAGILLLGLAVITLVEHFLIARWVHLETSANQSFVTAGIAALLGLALVQGSDGARKTAAWLTGLGIVALIALIPIGYVAAPEAGLSIAIVAGGGLLAAVALVGLLVGAPSTTRTVLCAFAFLAGSIGSVAVEMWLVKRGKRDLRALLIEWSTPERVLHDEPAGLDIKLPEGWVQLKPGNPLVVGDGIRAALGETSLGAVAAVVLDAEGQAFLSPDDYLDRWYAARREKLEGMTQKGREDVGIGAANGRKMKFTWSDQGRGMQGFATAWKDGRRYFCFWGWTTGSLAGAAAERFATLERSLSFSAPVDTFLQEVTPRVTAACPMLSVEAVGTLARSLPKTATPEAYCRRGLEWALRGQGQLPAAESAEFRSISQKLYGAMSERDRDRLGQYMDRLRQAQPTTPADDRAMSVLMAGAIRRLTADDQARLRFLTSLALEVGLLM